MSTWQLRDRGGNVVALHERRDFGDGKKSFYWRHPDGQTSKNGDISGLDKLYNLELLDRHPEVTSVVLVEGEKAADALCSLGLVALGTVCGASSTPSEDVLANLRGHVVTLWPDEDKAGKTHMERIGGLLQAQGVEVRMARWPGAPAKGDAADLIARTASLDVAGLKAAITIEPFQPSRQPTDEHAPTGAPHRLRVEDSDPPIWLMYFPRGVVRVQNGDLYTWSRVRDEHLAEMKAGVGWAPQSSREWNEVVADLLEGLDHDPDGHVSVPPARTWHGRVALLLQEMTRYNRGSRTRIDVDEERLYFHFAELVKRNAEDTHNQRGIDKERMTRVQLHQGVTRLGGHVATGRRESWVPLRELELEPEP